MADAALFPRVHAMLVCDEIERVIGVPGMYNLLRTRVEIQARRFPYLHPQLCVYLQMSGRQGTVSCHVKIVEAANDATVIEAGERQIPLFGPLVLRQVRWRLRRCVFPHVGLYYVQAYCGQMLIQERLLVLSQLSEASNDEPTPV